MHKPILPPSIIPLHPFASTCKTQPFAPVYPRTTAVHAASTLMQQKGWPGDKQGCPHEAALPGHLALWGGRPGRQVAESTFFPPDLVCSWQFDFKDFSTKDLVGAVEWMGLACRQSYILKGLAYSQMLLQACLNKDRGS